MCSRKMCFVNAAKNYLLGFSVMSHMHVSLILSLDSVCYFNLIHLCVTSCCDIQVKHRGNGAVSHKLNFFTPYVTGYNHTNVKGKVLPRTGHEGPEGEQMYSCTLPSASALDGGGWSTPRPGCFTPGKDPVPIV